MTDLVVQVLQYVTDHPLSNLRRIQDGIRKPAQEVEHAVGLLNRQGKIYQRQPYLWAPRPTLEPLVVRSDLAPVAKVALTDGAPPYGMKRCPRCDELKPKVEFGRSSRCRPCNRAYNREYWRLGRRA